MFGRQFGMETILLKQKGYRKLYYSQRILDFVIPSIFMEIAQTTAIELVNFQDRQRSLENIVSSTNNPTVEKNIENGDEVKFYFERLLRFDYSLMMMSSMNLALTILYADADYQQDGSNSQLCLLLMLGILFMSIIVTVLRYRAEVDLEISETELSKFDTIFSSEKYEIFVEIFVLLLQPYPFLNEIYIQTMNVRDDYTFNFKLNYILIILGFFKLFIIVRVCLLKTEYMSPRANRVCRLYEAKCDYLYAIKCLFKDYPMPLIGIAFLASICIFALGIRISERNLVIEDDNHKIATGQDLQSFTNALWLTIITMTTVGYGDFYPRTLIGRIIDVFLIIWGIFIVSLMVVVLTNTLNMDLSEKRALTVLNRLDLKAIQKKHAANYIINAWKKQCKLKEIKKLQQKEKTSGGTGDKDSTQNKIRQYQAEIEAYDVKLNQYSKEFKEIDKIMQSMFEVDDVSEQMTRQFENLMDEVNLLIKEQKDTEETLISFVKTQKEKKIAEHKISEGNKENQAVPHFRNQSRRHN